MKINRQVLINAIVDKGYSYQRLSQDTGISTATLSRWCQGDSNYVLLDKLVNVCKVLEIKPAVKLSILVDTFFTRKLFYAIA